MSELGIVRTVWLQIRSQAWALVWALAIVAAAFVFKGNPNVEWIEAGLVGVALSFVVLKPGRPGCLR